MSLVWFLAGTALGLAVGTCIGCWLSYEDGFAKGAARQRLMDRLDGTRP